MRELRDFGLFLLLFGALAAETFLLPQTASLRPWVAGEPMPLFGVLIEEEEEEVLASESVDGMPHRPPALAQSIELSASLDGFFEDLEELQAGGRKAPVRVLHFGDSTIAADGIPGVVRRRLQNRFGDRGPGFVPVRVDTQWVYRPGLIRDASGDWENWNLTQGGAPYRRYGLAGMPAMAREKARIRVGLQDADGRYERMNRFTLYLQLQPAGGTLRFGPESGPKQVLSTRSGTVRDSEVELVVPEGAERFVIEALGDGPVSLYGLALEKDQPGLTWETLGVAGSSIGSMRRQDVDHLKAAVASRAPSLLVYQTGGNALGYDSFLLGDGRIYKQSYLTVLGRLRAGAPDASCLVVGPLDQGLRRRGKVISRPEIPRMIAVQREAAQEAGCAFWDPREVMGGEGGFARWMNHEPTLTWTDLMHLSKEGSALMGNRMADSLLYAYGQWSSAQASVDNE
jgi:lysophospholipase L1-like esterase